MCWAHDDHAWQSVLLSIPGLLRKKQRQIVLRVTSLSNLPSFYSFLSFLGLLDKLSGAVQCWLYP